MYVTLSIVRHLIRSIIFAAHSLLFASAPPGAAEIFPILEEDNDHLFHRHNRHHSPTPDALLPEVAFGREHYFRRRNQLLCNYCGYWSHYLSNVKTHFYAHHSSLRPFQCHFCPKKFARATLRKDHERLHLRLALR